MMPTVPTPRDSLDCGPGVIRPFLLSEAGTVSVVNMLSVVIISVLIHAHFHTISIRSSTICTQDSSGCNDPRTIEDCLNFKGLDLFDVISRRVSSWNSFFRFVSAREERFGFPATIGLITIWGHRLYGTSNGMPHFSRCSNSRVNIQGRRVDPYISINQVLLFQCAMN